VKALIGFANYPIIKLPCYVKKLEKYCRIKLKSFHYNCTFIGPHTLKLDGMGSGCGNYGWT
jgi:hypothetical protein